MHGTGGRDADSLGAKWDKAVEGGGCFLGAKTERAAAAGGDEVEVFPFHHAAGGTGEAGLTGDEANKFGGEFFAVTVGVDEKGKDLLYEYKEGTLVADIPTRSLLAEYGYPPGKLQQTGPTLDPFVLFKFSE